MYIRVKRRRMKLAAVRKAEATGTAAPEEWALAFVVVESRRVEGRPRQRHLAYLGSLRESERDRPGERWFLWRRAGDAITTLADRFGEERATEVRRGLEARVPPAGAEEFADPYEWLYLMRQGWQYADAVLDGTAPFLAPHDLAGRYATIEIGRHEALRDLCEAHPDDEATQTICRACFGAKGRSSFGSRWDAEQAWAGMVAPDAYTPGPHGLVRLRTEDLPRGVSTFSS